MEKVKILVSGPESTGKTTLTQQLAEHFKLPHVEEFARRYFNDHPLSNEQAVIEHIAHQQIRLEKELAQENDVILCDTGLITIKVWMEFLGQKIPQFIEDYLQTSAYNFALLLYPNIPWVADSQRANPEDRLELFHNFQHALANYKIPYKIIDSAGDERLKDSIEAVNTFLSKV